MPYNMLCMKHRCHRYCHHYDRSVSALEHFKASDVLEQTQFSWSSEDFNDSGIFDHCAEIQIIQIIQMIDSFHKLNKKI